MDNLLFTLILYVILDFGKLENLSEYLFSIQLRWNVVFSAQSNWNIENSNAFLVWHFGSCWLVMNYAFLICRKEVSKTKRNMLRRDYYLELLQIYLHLSYHGRIWRPHRCLVSMALQYRLRIYFTCLQDMAQLTMWGSLSIFFACLIFMYNLSLEHFGAGCY